MTTDRGALAALLATLTVLGATATPVTAQTEPPAPVRGLERLQTPGAQANPDATAIPVPAAPTIVLPNITPAQRRAARRPSVAATPAPEPATSERSTSERTPPRRTPEPATQSRTAGSGPSRVSSPDAPAPRADPTPIATPTSEPARQPQPVPTPGPETTPQPIVTTTATTPATSTLSAPETGRTMPLWLSLTAIVVVLGALWALRRKPRSGRSDRIEPEVHVEPIPQPAAPEPVTPPVTAAPPAPAALTPVVPTVPAAAPQFLEPRAKTPPAAPRARLTCELRPLRAGLNLLSATVECELVVTNTGSASAEAIRVGVALLTAHADQDAELAQFNAAPVVRPAATPFALAAGEARTIRTVAAIARDAIRTMTAANRPMFVPVLATNILYATAGDDAQTARAWVIGIERVDSAKLAPFWLDAPARMYTAVAARPHAATFDR